MCEKARGYDINNCRDILSNCVEDGRQKCEQPLDIIPSARFGFNVLRGTVTQARDFLEIT